MEIYPQRARRAVYGLRAPRVAMVGRLGALGELLPTAPGETGYVNPDYKWNTETGDYQYAGPNQNIVTVRAARDGGYVLVDTPVDPVSGEPAAQVIIDATGTSNLPEVVSAPGSGRVIVKVKPGASIASGKNLEKVALKKNPPNEAAGKNLQKKSDEWWESVLKGLGGTLIVGTIGLGGIYWYCKEEGIEVPSSCYLAAVYPGMKSQCDQDLAKARAEKYGTTETGSTDQANEKKPKNTISGTTVAIYGALAVGILLIVRAVASRK